MTRKIISVILAMILCCSFAISVSAGEAGQTFLYDEAALLTDREAYAVEKKLADVSGTYRAQIVVCTIDSTEGWNIDDYLYALYDGMDFGYGAGRDGVMLLVCMDLREYRILSNGFPGTAIDYHDIDNIGDAIVSDLSDGNYGRAFTEFADQCAYYLDVHQNGYPFNAGRNMLIALAIGLAAGLCVALVLKAQLRSVHDQNQANVYIKRNSMKITGHSDIFLYRTVRRSRRSSDHSSGSRSSRSSGGGSF